MEAILNNLANYLNDEDDFCHEEQSNICQWCGNKYPKSETLLHKEDIICIDCYNEDKRNDY